MISEAWAETIRGLVVHSANWNAAMLAQHNVQQGNRAGFRNLLRTFGFGVPDLDRALYSQESALTYIAKKPFSRSISKKEAAQPKLTKFIFSICRGQAICCFKWAKYP